MGILLVGLNHRTAPLPVRERLSFPAEALDPALRRFTHLPGVREGMILSTCNRTELLAHASGSGELEGAEAVTRFFAAERDFPAPELDRYCYRMQGRDAVHHLFRVAASLDSMVLGEAQILGQVKEAYRTARAAGSIGTVLDPVLRRALGVAKKVRSQTGIARHPRSIGTAAVSLARTIFEELAGRRVLVLGAGKMGEIAARALKERGAGSLIIVNRSAPRALELAQRLAGVAEPFERLEQVLEEVDIVISCTAAEEPILRAAQVARLMRARKGRPIFLIDIAVPRDIDPKVNTLEHVYLYDLDDLGRVVDAGREGREEEARRAEEIVRRELESFEQWSQHRDLSPVIVEAREKLEALRAAELDRHRGALASLTPEQRRAVDEITSGLVSKILHPAIRAVKRAAREAQPGARVRLFRETLGLDAAASEPEDSQEASEGARSEDDPSRAD
jgi:glutamyl-tRNA reductase